MQILQKCRLRKTCICRYIKRNKHHSAFATERAKLKISTVQHWRHKIVYTLFKYIITYFGIKIKYFAVLCRSMSVGNKDCCFFQQIQFNNHYFKLRTTAEAKKISAVKVCSEKGFLKIDFSQETFIGGKVLNIHATCFVVCLHPQKKRTLMRLL